MKLDLNLQLVQTQNSFRYVKLHVTFKSFLLKSWYYLVFQLSLSVLPKLCLLSGFSSFVFSLSSIFITELTSNFSATVSQHRLSRVLIIANILDK